MCEGVRVGGKLGKWGVLGMVRLVEGGKRWECVVDCGGSRVGLGLGVIGKRWG